MWLGWYDPTTKHPIEKIEEAIRRYREKWNEQPDTVLLNIADAEHR